MQLYGNQSLFTNHSKSVAKGKVSKSKDLLDAWNHNLSKCKNDKSRGLSAQMMHAALQARAVLCSRTHTQDSAPEKYPTKYSIGIECLESLWPKQLCRFYAHSHTLCCISSLLTEQHTYRFLTSIPLEPAIMTTSTMSRKRP